MLKDRLSKTSGWCFTNGFSDPKSFRDFRETGPWSQSREAAKRKKLPVSLDLNLTFMETPAVKPVKLIIAKGTNGNMAITHPLGITNQTKRSY